MDIIRMTGGLGNQMFQYALYLKLCAMGREVRLDDQSEYTGKDNARPIMLWVFGISYPRATREEINQLTDGSLRLSCRIRRKLWGRHSLEYHEKDGNFDPEILKRTPAYLTGYFQSEQYFQDIEETVREAFTFSKGLYEKEEKALEESLLKLRREMADSLSVSIHIRRGDYLENSEVYGGICTESYYASAIDLMKKRFPEAVFFVFSNEDDWCEKWCRRQRECHESDFRAVTGIPEEKGYLAMELMSRCRHHIIANSSFSWWASYLNPDRGKCVIAPARWFNNQDCRDIYREEMVRIDGGGEVGNV